MTRVHYGLTCAVASRVATAHPTTHQAPRTHARITRATTRRFGPGLKG